MKKIPEGFPPDPCPHCGGLATMRPMGKGAYDYCILCGVVKLKQENPTKTKAPE